MTLRVDFSKHKFPGCVRKQVVKKLVGSMYVAGLYPALRKVKISRAVHEAVVRVKIKFYVDVVAATRYVVLS